MYNASIALHSSTPDEPAVVVEPPVIDVPMAEAPVVVTADDGNLVTESALLD